MAEAGGIVPAGTPVILCGPETESATTYTLTFTTGGSYTGENLMHGTDVATTTETAGANRYYKLSYGPSGTEWADEFGWYWGAADGGAFSIGAHRAWLALNVEQAGEAKHFALRTETADGIRSIEATDGQSTSHDATYDLQGRRLSNTQFLKAGIYIRNGKKFMVR